MLTIIGCNNKTSIIAPDIHNVDSMSIRNNKKIYSEGRLLAYDNKASNGLCMIEYCSTSIDESKKCLDVLVFIEDNSSIISTFSVNSDTFWKTNRKSLKVIVPLKLKHIKHVNRLKFHTFLIQ